MRISDWSSDVCSSDLEFLKSYIKLILLILIDNNLGHDVLYCINYITNDRNSHTMSPEIREALELGFSESASTSLEGRLLALVCSELVEIEKQLADIQSKVDRQIGRASGRERVGLGV